MRWPFSRHKDSVVAPETLPVDTPAGPTPERPAGAHPGRRAWQTLPPLTPVIARPVITISAPDAVVNRSMIHRPVAPTHEDRPAGRVIGLADVLPALDVEHPAPQPEAPRAIPVTTHAVPRPSLTAATDTYVGEAREPANPHRAPGWLRALSQSPVMDTLLGGVAPALPGPPPAAPARSILPRMPAGEAPPRRPIRPRGRLGLGAPLQPESAETEPEPAAPPAFLRSAGPAQTSPAQMSAAQTSAAQMSAAPLPAAPTTAGHTSAHTSAAQTSAAPVGTPALPSSPLVAPPTRVAAPRHPASAEPAAPAVPAVVTPRSISVPPAELIHEVRTATGADLDRVAVHRGPEVDRQAEQMAAVAFTADDAVHLGSAAGHDDSAEARAVLAHELVHIAQQRMLGAGLPDESSPEGGALEAEAVAVEQAVRAGRPVPRLTHPTAVRGVATGVTEPAGNNTTVAAPLTLGLGGASWTSSGAGVRRASAAPVPVRGRVQRRPNDLEHAPSVSAPQAQTATAAPSAPAPEKPAEKPADKPAEKKTEKPAETPPPTIKERFANLGQGVANELGEMVLASWSLEDLTGKDSKSSGGSGGSGGSSKGGGGSGDNSRQARFNRIAQQSLDHINAGRREKGEPDLTQLPQAEEERIWREVDAGGGSADGSGGGGGGNKGAEHGIRSWSELGTALTNDYVDTVASTFGMDFSELMKDDEKADDKPGAGGKKDDKHHDQHKKIEPDEIDLDELGHRLYDRIRSRLRLELLLDRERAGLLNDFR